MTEKEAPTSPTGVLSKRGEAEGSSSIYRGTREEEKRGGVPKLKAKHRKIKKTLQLCM